jgi:hypothetical protein
MAQHSLLFPKNRSMRSLVSGLLLLIVLWPTTHALANNIAVAGVRLTDRNVSAGANNAANHTFVRFNLSWDNAWRLGPSTGMYNRDAAWVFVKYRVLGGPWQHAELNDLGHSAGTWTGLAGNSAALEIGVQNPSDPYNANSNPVKGVLMYLGSNGVGQFKTDSVKLRWNYGAQGITDDELVEVRVFAIEMVYLPRGSFYVGTGGLETASFTDGSWSSGPTLPLRIGTEGSLPIGTSSGNLWATANISAGTLPAAFPKGVEASYAMKYEISQKQWVDFFNTLTAVQKASRDLTDSDGKSSDTRIDRNNISWSAGDASLIDEEYGEVACNFLSWSDVAAYLDWSGLRPMTELEFEKAVRGEQAGQPNEYVWGSAFLQNQAYSLNNAGLPNESISANYGLNSLGNAAYAGTKGVDGPLRVGIFAGNLNSYGRNSAGATRHGQLEMSGNVSEYVVNVGSAQGIAYSGLHGNGQLSATGEADVTNWPSTNGLGSGTRGGHWNSPASELQAADRSMAVASANSRSNTSGGRGVRSSPCTGPSAPDSITLGTLSNGYISFSTGGAGSDESYLWQIPADWRIVNGQGTATLLVLVGSLPGTVTVVLVDDCGAGAAVTATLNN